MATKRTTKKVATLDENLSPSERLAAEIVARHGDLAPSVRRILAAEDLGETGKMHAITLFRDSLGVPGDPNRHPMRAAEAGRAFEQTEQPEQTEQSEQTEQAEQTTQV